MSEIQREKDTMLSLSGTKVFFPIYKHGLGALDYTASCAPFFPRFGTLPLGPRSPWRLTYPPNPFQRVIHMPPSQATWGFLLELAGG